MTDSQDKKFRVGDLVYYPYADLRVIPSMLVIVRIDRSPFLHHHHFYYEPAGMARNSNKVYSFETGSMLYNGSRIISRIRE